MKRFWSKTHPLRAMITVYILLQLQTKIIKSLPDILAMNCHLENSRDFEFWKVQEEVRFLVWLLNCATK